MTERLLFWLTFILFLIPFTLFIVDNHVLFPFITTKAIIFRVLVTIGLFLAFWIYLLNPQTFPKKNYLILSLLLFLLSNIIATILSVNPFRSFWGNAERMEGLWSLFFYLGYFFLLFTLFQFSPKSKKIIFLSFLIVTALISLIEINQAFFQKIDRPYATLGNATYIGFMNLLMIFLLLFFFFETNSFFEKLTYLALILLNLISLLASGTRGSILGLLVGAFAFTIFYVIFSKIETRKKVYVFVGLFLFILIFYYFLHTEIALLIPGIKRIAETLQNPVSVFPRLYAWKIFFNAFFKKPFFGWGPETMPIAFFSNLDPQIFNYEKAIFDKPHNKFLEILTSTGIFGFLCWFLIFIAFAYYVLIYFKEKPLLKSSLLAFVFAYFAQIFTLFDMQTSYLLLFFGLSLVTPSVNFKEDRERFIRPYLILAAGFFLFILIFHLQHYYLVRSIITYLRESDIKKASQGFLRLSEIEAIPFTGLPHPFLTEQAIMVNNYLSSNALKLQDFKEFSNFYEVIFKAYHSEPKDYRLTNIYLDKLLILIKTKKIIGQDPSKEIEESKEIYEKLIKNSPNLPEVYLIYSIFLFDIGESEKAESILKNGEKLSKIYPRYSFETAKIYFNQNRFQKAYENLEKALQNGFELNYDNDFELTLKIYVKVKDQKKINQIVKMWKTKNPSTSTLEKIEKILSEL